MEPAAGDEGSRADTVAGAITIVVARRRFQYVGLLRLLLGSISLIDRMSDNIEFWKIAASSQLGDVGPPSLF